MEPYKIITTKNYDLLIKYEDNPEDPRDWDNLSTFALFHNRYSFSNETDIKSEDHDSWFCLQEAITKKYNPIIIKTVYAYIHSGIALSLERTGQFADRWDSGTLGFIFISREKATAEFGRITKKVKEKLDSILNAEFETYKDFIEGEVFGYVLTKKALTCPHCSRPYKPEQIDSCWGFYGDDFEKNGLFDNLPEEFIKEMKELKEKEKQVN